MLVDGAYRQFEGRVAGVVAIGRAAKFFSRQLAPGSTTIYELAADDVVGRARGEAKKAPIYICDDIGVVRSIGLFSHARPHFHRVLQLTGTPEFHATMVRWCSTASKR